MDDMSRKQCKKCPWKVTTDPWDIPFGYDDEKHKGLRRTIAEEGAVHRTNESIMACHEYPVGAERVCVGWLHNQLGPGNNIPLRMMVSDGWLNDELPYELDGEQHEKFEDTLP